MRKDKEFRKSIVQNYYNQLMRKCYKNRIDKLNKWCDTNLDMNQLFPGLKSEDNDSFKSVITAIWISC